MSPPTCVSSVLTLVSAKKWFNTVRPSPIRDMTVCEACFLDRAGWQQNIAQHVAQVTSSPLHIKSQMICDFRLAPMAACSDILLAYGMFEKWHYVASSVLSKPICNEEGIIDGEWYGLPDRTDATRTIEKF